MSDDSALLRAYVTSADETAFTALVQRHIGFVYHAALRQLGNPMLAEDAAQIVFIRLVRKAPALLRHTSLIGWLHTTTRFVAHELHRGETRRLRREQHAQLMQDALHPDRDPAHSWDRLRPVVDEALGDLNDSDRTALLLRYFADLPLATVGARLRISENAARMRVDRALEKLRLRLARRGVTSTAAALGAGLAQHTAFAAPAGLATAAATGALSSAGVASAGTAAFTALQLMTTTKTAAIAVGAIALLALGTAFQQTKRARTAETLLGARSDEIVRLTALLHDAKRRALTLPPAASASPAAASPRSSPARRSSNIPATLDDAIDQLVFTNPELAQLFLQQETIRLHSTYGPLYQALHFTPAQIDRFEKILAEYAQTRSDIRVAALSKGTKKNDPSLQTLFDDAAAQRDAQLRQFLGESDFDRYEDYNHFQRGRTLSDRLATEFYYTDHPLTAAQADAMAHIALNHSAQITGTGLADWDRITTEAQAVLLPQQLAALSKMKEQAELGMKIHRITGPVVQQFNGASPP